MIKIIFRQTEMYYRLEVKGHAYYDVPGKDIVCAAVSAITQALALKLDKIYLSEEILTYNGQLDMLVKRDKDKEEVLEALFDMAITYLVELENHYPEHVKVFL